MKSKVQSSYTKNQIIAIIVGVVLSLAYVLCVVFTWDSGFWKRDDYIGNIFGPAKDSLKYAFSSWINVIFTFIMPIIFMSVNIGVIFGTLDKQIVKILYIVIWAVESTLFLASFVTYIIMFVNCTPVIAMIYNLCFGVSLIYFLPFVMLLSSTCTKCYHLNTKELIDTTKRKSYSTNYVPGGYRTVKADVKDESGNVIGSIETQRYEKGHSYTSSNTTVTRRYKCSVCGNVTESSSSS